MRTRFLSTDYFTATATTAANRGVAAATSSYETLKGFFNLPVPQLPPPSRLSVLNDDDLNILRFDFDSVLNVSLEIERLPIDSALSKFLAHVIPQTVDAGDFASSNCEEKDNVTADDEHIPMSEIIQFETPELHEIFLESACHLKKEDMQILSEFQEIENNLDIIKPGLELQYPSAVKESVYSVEDVTSEGCTEQKAYELEYDGSLQDQTQFLHHITFPLLEVDEISLGTSMSLCMEDVFLSLLENNEPQNWNEKNNLLMNGKELLGSMEYDILEFLSDQCLSNRGLISEVALPDVSLELDIIRMVDSQFKESPEIHQGTPDGACFCAVNMVTFQEFQFLDVDSSQLFECFFGKQAASKPETCEWVVREDTNFKNFDELIISHELALADDTFRSLPVPVLPDHGKFRAMSVIVEEILAELKPQSLSLANGIYLDWHVLDEYKCNFKSYSSTLSMLEEKKSHSIDFDQESLHDGKLIFEFAVADIASDKPDDEKKEESLNSLSDGISILNSHLMGVPSTKLLNCGHTKPGNGEQIAEKAEKSPKVSSDGTSMLNGQLYGAASSEFLDAGCPKPANEEQIAEKKAEKAFLLFKSMSQFDDLDLFLNPQKATGKANTESAGKAFNSNATIPKVSSHELSSATTGIKLVQKDVMLYQEGDIDSILVLGEDMNNKKLKEPLKVTPVMEKSSIRPLEAADEVEARCMILPDPLASCAVDFEKARQDTMTFSNAVIIVNTLSLDKEMIVSRRSTYQKILAIEKEGAQVVERDSELPVDVILSSALCLVWYDCRNIARKATPSDEGSSCLPLCIENIATSILTSLSFAFNGCILIFEGDFSFLSTVMESSDELYAAAASLGIDLQLFCSYSSELTDEIILSCIEYASTVTRGQYPKMLESETLAESFLTKFPSVNPLTAHVIMSSGGMLIEFLEWSHERRIHAMQKYFVPHESINLFTALCRYGEREDSKSIMTDCSSSVSSDPGSGKCHSNADSQRKRQQCISGLQKNDTLMDNLFLFEPLDQVTDSILNTMSNPNGSWMSKDPNSSLKDLFAQKQEGGIAMTMNSSSVSNLNDYWISEGPQALDDVKKFSLDPGDKFLGQDQGSATTTMNNLEWLDANNCENLHEGFRGEVIDLTNSRVSGDDFCSIGKSMHIPPVPVMEKDSTRKSKTVRRLSFGINSHHTFPTAAEICSNSSDWDSAKEQRQNFRQTKDDPDAGNDNDKLPLKDTKNLLEEILARRHKKNNQELPYQEETSDFSRTPLSNALHSADPQPGSPWTIEFLNRIREKSRKRVQSIPCDTSSPCFGHSGNASKVTKRRSPSILEFFKYQGGNTPKKIPEQKRLKRSMQPSGASVIEKPTASFPSTWTPQDKKARKTLSFAMPESGSQTKLIWNNGSAHAACKKFRNQ